MTRPEMIRVYDGVPVPYSDGQLRMDILPARAPSGHLPDDFLAQFDVFRPVRIAAPDVTATQITEEATVATLVDGAWVYAWIVRDKTSEELAADTAAKVEAVKAEAYRRIIALCPEWKQRNLTAQAAQLAKKGEANWTQAEADAWAAGEALWTQIAAIRAASDTIEALDPIPDDFSEYWP